MPEDRDGLEEVLAYLARLDDGLEAGMRPAERKLVRRDVRHAVEDLAFRLAWLDDRLAPGDLDYVRALEALHAPPEAARRLLAQRPAYRRRARRAAVRGFATLAVLVLVVAGVSALASRESSVFLGEYARGHPQAVTASEAVAVDVPAGLSRVYLVVEPVVRDDGLVTVSVLGPRSELLYQKSFARADVNYDDRNLPAPEGAWTVVVDYRDAAAHVRVRLTGVAPS